MSLAIAIKHNDVVYLGADTLASNGNYIINIPSLDVQKIVKVGSCYVCCTGKTPIIKALLKHTELFNCCDKYLR